jgi:hypothetical protein
MSKRAPDFDFTSDYDGETENKRPRTVSILSSAFVTPKKYMCIICRDLEDRMGDKNTRLCFKHQKPTKEAFTPVVRPTRPATPHEFLFPPKEKIPGSTEPICVKKELELPRTPIVPTNVSQEQEEEPYVSALDEDQRVITVPTFPFITRKKRAEPLKSLYHSCFYSPSSPIREGTQPDPEMEYEDVEISASEDEEVRDEVHQICTSVIDGEGEVCALIYNAKDELEECHQQMEVFFQQYRNIKSHFLRLQDILEKTEKANNDLYDKVRKLKNLNASH